MNNDPHLHGLRVGERSSKPRLSREVLTPLLIAAGVIGVPLAFGLSQCSSENETTSTPPTVNANTEYPNNHFLPGAGYYHAPFFGWFPMPFNYYQAGSGWYRGGQWRPSAQETEEERRAGASTGGGFARAAGGGGAGFAHMQSSRPTPEAVQRANTAAVTHAGPVMRGGFGQSSRPGIS